MKLLLRSGKNKLVQSTLKIAFLTILTLPYTSQLAMSASLVKGGVISPNWMGDGNSFWYMEGGPREAIAFKVDPGANAVSPLFDTSKVREAIADKLGYEPLGRGLPFDNFHFLSADSIKFSLYDGGKYSLDLGTYQVEKLEEESEGSLLAEAYATGKAKYTPQWFLREPFWARGKSYAPEAMSPDGRWLLGLNESNIYIRATIDGLKIPLTNDGTMYHEWDVDSFNYYPWSPDAQRFVVSKVDSSGMDRIPTIQFLKRKQQVFPHESVSIAAGAPQQRVQLYVFDVHSRTPVAVKQDDSQFYYYRVLSWLPNSEGFLIARYTRLLDQMDIQYVDGRTGESKTVFTDKTDTFLTSYTRAFSGPRTVFGVTVLSDSSSFIQVSNRDGWQHLYLVGVNGKLKRQLTKGSFRVEEVVRVDEEDGWVYFKARSDQSRPYDLHLCRVSLKGTSFQQLTSGDGIHHTSISPSGEYFVDTFSSVSIPPKTVLRKASGELIRTLSEADISALEKTGWTTPQEVIVKAADGVTDIWVTMDFPINFDPNKKYPVVEYIYGGQFTTIRRQEFFEGKTTSHRGAPLPHYEKLLEKGFITISMDSRGTPERSSAFLTAIYHNSDVIIDDHAAAIRQLADRFPYFDAKRVGINGASLGGYYSTRAVLMAPEEYHVAFSEVPAYDVEAGRYREYFLGLPQDNPELYERANMFNKAHLLQGKLFIAGGINDTVSIGSLFKMSEALVQAGKKHEMFILADTRHGAPGKRGDFLDEMIYEYFVEHLNP